jgi:phage terminase Nu1 subunit (DNA packaging protein)
MARKKRNAPDDGGGKDAGGSSTEVSAGTLSKLLSLSEVHLGRLASQGVIHRTRYGHYDLWQSVRAYVVYLHQRIRDGRSAPPEHTRDLASAKIRESRERADRLSLDNARLRRELVSVEDMVSGLSTFIAAARERVLGSSLQPEERDRLLNDFAGLLTSIASDHERSGNGVSAPGKPDRTTAQV